MVRKRINFAQPRMYIAVPTFAPFLEEEKNQTKISEFYVVRKLRVYN